MNPSGKTTNESASSPEEVELASDLAAFAKAFFLYPESNSRVRKTRQKVLDGLDVYLAELQAFTLEVRRDELRVPSGRLEERPLLNWFGQALENTAVSSLRMERGVTAESLHQFLNRLRKNLTDRSNRITFSTRWPDQFPGIVLGESRYLGGFHDEIVEESTDRGSVREVIEQGAGTQPGSSRGSGRSIPLNDRILEQIRRIERMLKQRGEIEGTDLSINLLDELTAALPTTAGTDSSASQRLTEEVLDNMLPALEGMVMGAKEGEHTKIYSVIRELAGRFFRTHRRSEEEQKTPTPKNNPVTRRDGQITDDLDAMLEEFTELPHSEVLLQRDDAAAQAEALRTCLQELGRCRRDHLAELVCGKVAAILKEPAPESLWVLDQYVGKLLDPGHNRLDLHSVRRVMDRFAANGLLPVLRDCRAVDPQSLVRSFPAGFTLFIDSLDSDSDEFDDTLGSICTSIGDSRIRRAEPTLAVPDGLLRHDRVDKILVPRRREFLPFARILARHADSDGQLRTKIAGYIRSLELDCPEILTIQVVEPQSKIPASFLADLCNSILDNEENEKLRDYAGFLIRSFIEGLPNDDAFVGRKSYAILALQKFPGAETEKLVREQLRGKGLFGLVKPCKEIRDAGNRVLATIGAK